MHISEKVIKNTDGMASFVAVSNKIYLPKSSLCLYEVYYS
jgi:hypothetical protein